MWLIERLNRGSNAVLGPFDYSNKKSGIEPLFEFLRLRIAEIKVVA